MIQAEPIRGPTETATWLTYAQAASYTGWSVRHLRNLVSSGSIPVYGKPRVRRFRRDMLDLFLTNPDAAMRKFRLERNEPHGR
jgi:excisionase family DNA binding protein